MLADQTTVALQDIKERVALSFGGQADEYNRHAYVQRVAAERLADLADDLVRDLSGPFIELGCGTGFVTNPIASKLSSGSLSVTDISEEMLQACQRDLQTGNHLELEFFIRDGEATLPVSTYGLIFTALTAQWFSNTHLTLLSHLEALKPGGVLLYSYLDDRCFPEWKALCAETHVAFTGNALPAGAPLKIDASRYSWEFFTPELFTENYECPAEFFKNLKRIGAGTQSTGKRNNPGAIATLNQNWISRGKPEFNVTYGITFGAIRKNA